MCAISSEGVTPPSLLLRAHVPLPLGSLLLRHLTSAKSLCRLYAVPAAHGSFPTLSLKVLPWMLDPVPRRYSVIAGSCFEDANISYCSGLQVCSPPRSSLPLRIHSQGSRGFYVRAYRALLPPHAPDILTARIQAIGGTGTCTLSDSQPCRLLTSLPEHYTRFNTTTRWSAPGRRIGTFSLTVSPLVPCPLASPDRFSSSIREPESESRPLNTGHHMASK